MRPPAFSFGGQENMRNSTTALVRVPISSQGRNLPQRVLVLATITPMIGSLKASNTRAAIRMMPMATALTPSRSWK